MNDQERRGRLDDLDTHLRYAKPELTDADVRVLRECLRDPVPSLRQTAIRILCELGPVTWDDLADWMIDSDPYVRQGALLYTTCATAARELCASDIARYTTLLNTARASDAETVGMLSTLMWSVAHDDEGALALTWQAAGQLLDMGIAPLTDSIASGYSGGLRRSAGLESDSPRRLSESRSSTCIDDCHYQHAVLKHACNSRAVDCLVEITDDRPT